MKIDLSKDCLEQLKQTRIELINKSGRLYVNNNIKNAQISIQDDGRTLKIFIND